MLVCARYGHFNLIFCFSGESPPIYGSTVGRQENVNNSLTKVKIDKEAQLTHVLRRPQAYRNIFVRLNMGMRLMHVVITIYVDETRDDHEFYIFTS